MKKVIVLILLGYVLALGIGCTGSTNNNSELETRVTALERRVLTLQEAFVKNSQAIEDVSQASIINSESISKLAKALR